MANTLDAVIERLLKKDVRFSTVIDVGCADGNFFLDHFSRGLFPGAVPLNIDANRIYEPSLSAIKEVVGGDYHIGAVSDHMGEIEIVEAVHPYWSSIRPPGDLYWNRINELVKATVKVSATTLDSLAKDLALKPPFLLKLDVQGAERSVLHGSPAVLANCHVIISEADVADFQGLNETLGEAGFALYDLTMLSRVEDGSLAWFYPVYVNKRLDHVFPRAFWQEKDNDSVIRVQVERRLNILRWNAEKLSRLRVRNSKTGRNDPCPCGSGRRFKHCCGAYR